MLKIARNVEPFAVFDKVGSCLVEIERHSGLNTLLAQIEHPVEIKWSGIFAGLATNTYFFNEVRIEIFFEIDLLNHRGNNN